MVDLLAKHEGPSMDHMDKDHLLRELLNPQWERVMTVFEAWDEAGNVDRAEFVCGMAALGISLDTPEVDRVFATFGRESSVMLDVRELLAALRTHKDKQIAAMAGSVNSAPLRVRRSSRLQGQAVPPPHCYPPTLPSALWPRAPSLGWWRGQAGKSCAQAPASEKLTAEELTSAIRQLKKAVRLNHVKARNQHIVQSR